MKGIRKLYLVLVLLVVSTLQMMAQQKITGRVIDDDGFAVSYASVQYKGHKIAVSSDRKEAGTDAYRQRSELQDRNGQGR